MLTFDDTIVYPVTGARYTAADGPLTIEAAIATMHAWYVAAESPLDWSGPDGAEAMSITAQWLGAPDEPITRERLAEQCRTSHGTSMYALMHILGLVARGTLGPAERAAADVLSVHVRMIIGAERLTTRSPIQARALVVERWEHHAAHVARPDTGDTMHYVIRTTDTRSFAESYPSQAAALAAIVAAYDWLAPVVSDRYQVDDGTAVSVYETQAECDADLDGAFAPRIVEITPAGRQPQPAF